MSKYDKTMITTAFTFSKQSYCNRLKVGAVLAKDGRILATGYNGTIAGMDNCCEHKCTICNGTGEIYIQAIDSFSIQTCTRCNGTGNVTNDLTLHAEQNLITFCAKNGIPTYNTTMYITHAPCKQCSKLIAQSGVKEVVYAIEYRDAEGIEFLRKCSIKVRKENNA